MLAAFVTMAGGDCGVADGSDQAACRKEPTPSLDGIPRELQAIEVPVAVLDPQP
jgi:hypothetical protein